MRILYLMTEPFGFGGVQSDMLALGKAYSDKGHSVAVATAKGERVPELEATGTEFIELNMRFWSPWRLFQLGRALTEIVESRRIDILAPQSVRTTLVCWAALRLFRFRRGVARLPIVTTIHNIHNPVHFRYAGHILQTCCDYVIFESNYERNRLLASGLSQDRSEVVHSGIDTQRFQPRPADELLAEQYGVTEESLVYGIVARFSEEKGHDHLLRAFADVSRQIPTARLMLIGDGPLESDIRELVSRLGLESKVIFTGAQRNIPEHLSIIDVFVLASTRESFPLSAREAMASGVPVIAPAIGGCGEVVDDGVSGFLFESANEADLSDKMLRMSNRKTRAACASASLDRATRLFGIDQWVQGDEEIYSRFVA